MILTKRVLHQQHHTTLRLPVFLLACIITNVSKKENQITQFVLYEGFYWVGKTPMKAELLSRKSHWWRFARWENVTQLNYRRTPAVEQTFVARLEGYSGKISGKKEKARILFRSTKGLTCFSFFFFIIVTNLLKWSVALVWNARK